jgi:hypothetical protein
MLFKAGSPRINNYMNNRLGVVFEYYITYHGGVRGGDHQSNQGISEGHLDRQLQRRNRAHDFRAEQEGE